MDQESLGVGQEIKDRIKGVVEELRKSEEALSPSLRRTLEEIDPFALESAEEELQNEGFSQDDMMILCDAHVQLMGEITEDEEVFLELPGHPIHTLMEEHVHILRFMERVRDASRRLRAGEPRPEDKGTFEATAEFLEEARKHFQREENVLFPYLERHGITGPPARMWAEHDVLRRKEKELVAMVERAKEGEKVTGEQLDCLSSQLLSLLNAHFYKENHVLFPTSIRLMDVHEWNEVRRQFEEVGFGNFMPQHAALTMTPQKPAPPQEAATEGNEIVLPTGRFTPEELEIFLNNLPVDVTFVDKDDRVRYYSGSPDRIFVRTPAVLGRKVQNCHPQKSVHMVQQIVEGFKNGTRSQAEFWIQLEGRFIHIRYWPLKDKNGDYLGVLEMVQDITGLRKLEGQKRLLD